MWSKLRPFALVFMGVHAFHQLVSVFVGGTKTGRKKRHLGKRAMRFRLRQWGVTNPASLLRNKTWDEPVQRFEKSLQSLQPMRQRMRRSCGHTLWLRSTWNYGTTWPNECPSDQSSQNQPPKIRRFAGPQPTWAIVQTIR